MNSLRAVLAQGALLVQGASYFEHPVFDSVRRAIPGPPHTDRTIAPIDSIQPLRSRTGHPELHGAQRHTELSRHYSHPTALANRSNHAATLTGRQRFFAIVTSIRIGVACTCLT
jgi:hypothetical protein